MNKLHRTLLSLAIFLCLTPALAAQEAPTVKAEATSAQPQAATPANDFVQETKSLERTIAAILAASDVTQGTVGIHAVDVASGEVLYSRSADKPMNPASNMKLITAAAALDKFGPQHTFETKLLARQVDGNTVKDSLYVKGDGEAFLLFEDVLDWAGQLRQKGITSIEGDIVIDDSAFNEGYLPPGFEQKDEDASYRSPIGAVSINFNAVKAVIEPGETPGAEAKVRMVPPNDHVEIDNQVQTVSGKRRNIRVSSQATDGGTRLVVSGRIGADASPFVSRGKRIDNPPAFAGAVLAEALEMLGVEFSGAVKTGRAPEDADVLVGHSSQPLSYVLLAMNKWSNNFMAEQVLRTLGCSDDAASTWDGSKAEVLAFLQKAGVDTEALTIHNGSGLYAGNEVSPRQFVELLRYMHAHPWGPEFMSTLAVAGTDGTLANRMTDGLATANVRAKTGTLNEVSALSGYLRTESGRLVAFSVLVNDPPRRAWHYRPVQDRIVEAIVGFEG